jgi:hypothetical protein
MPWSKLSLQVKIGIVMTPMILPVCVIVHLSHASGADTSVTASNGMSALVVEQGAAQVGTHLEASRNRFLGWTAEDVYGMAIDSSHPRRVNRWCCPPRHRRGSAATSVCWTRATSPRSGCRSRRRSAWAWR